MRLQSSAVAKAAKSPVAGVSKHAASRWGTYAFTLTELLVVIAILAVLSSLLLPALSQAKASAAKAVCISNLKQLTVGVLNYANDNSEILPGIVPADSPWLQRWGAFKRSIRLDAASTNQSANQLFCCPADKFYYGSNQVRVEKSVHAEAEAGFSSYVLNAGNNLTNVTAQKPFPGIAGLRVDSIADAARTVLITESPALAPYSWHRPRPLPRGQWRFQDALDNIGFVDGHATQAKMYWNMNTGPGAIEAWQYNPPPIYIYKWTAD